MSLAEFRTAFPGESQHVEFKRGTSMEQLQSTAVAFANADGGVILIGVQDDGAIAASRPTRSMTSTGPRARGRRVHTGRSAATTCASWRPPPGSITDMSPTSERTTTATLTRAPGDQRL
jgi:ATP-dependent DNA helicase RecG